MSFYTYVHCKADTGEVFYVGKGTGARAWDKGVLDRSLYWQRVVAKHGHQVEVCAYFDVEAEAFEHERFLISCFRGLGMQLANHTDGGEGYSGRRHSETTKQYLSVIQKGRKRDPVLVERTAASLRGKKHSLERIEKRVAAFVGYKHTDEAKLKIKEKRAAQEITDAHKQAISTALRAYRQRVKAGCATAYKKTPTPVVGHKAGEFRRWVSAAACAKDLGYNQNTSVINALNRGLPVRGWVLKKVSLD